MPLRLRPIARRATVCFACSFWLLLGAVATPAAAQQAVTTYHYDNYRTGWNSIETTLTPSNVGSSSFGLLQTVTLDDQVDAQPLFVPNVNITAGNYQGVHNVLYVASENNTVYAIDAQSGQILLSPNFGAPVPKPLGCTNNGPNVGINSTPVIDLSTNTLYVMIYTNDNGNTPTYRLHALDLGSLADKVTAQVVSASHTLTDATTFNFNATYQRQRPGLLLANGSVYAGFGSFCDFAANVSRGWLLGWAVNTLTPLAANQMFDTQATSTNSFFLSSIWMSGYGLAADDSGNILFVTGNSDYSGTTYDGVTNIQESVVKVSSDLTTIKDYFTPRNVGSLDQGDSDFGSGGVMVLPDQPGSKPHLAVAAGKAGTLFFMNADALGGYSSTKNNMLAQYGQGACWCGPSYFVDPTDSLARVVTSGSRTVKVWRLNTSSTGNPSLTQMIVSGSVGGGQNGGFFTTISSNGTSNPIIWAVSRPKNGRYPNINLWAFNPESGGTTMTTLFTGVAGQWNNTGGNANIVPLVANGEVFVASNKQLQIFGIKSSKSASKGKKK
jgi:hypothetical protein